MPPAYAFFEKNERDGSTDTSSGQSLTLQYEATCDDATVSAGEVIAALDTILGIHKGSAHPNYAYALCTTIAAKVVPADPFRWDVTATYKETRPQPGSPVNPSGGQPSPPDRAPWVTGSFRREDVFRTVDNSPNDGVSVFGPYPFTNSAGDLLDNPPPIPLAVGQITVTRYYDAISYTALKGYENKCNADVWSGFPKHSLCVMGITWEPATLGAWSGWKVVFTVEHRDVTPEQQNINDLSEIADLEDGITGGFHPVPLLDVGFYYYPGGAGNKTVYDEPAGSGVAKPVPGFLDGINGDRHTAPHHRGFDIHGRISFAILG
jgi:hypothetical protein